MILGGGGGGGGKRGWGFGVGGGCCEGFVGAGRGGCDVGSLGVTGWDWGVSVRVPDSHCCVQWLWLLVWLRPGAAVQALACCTCRSKTCLHSDIVAPLLAIVLLHPAAAAAAAQGPACCTCRTIMYFQSCLVDP